MVKTILDLSRHLLPYMQSSYVFMETMAHVINLRQQFCGFLSVSKLWPVLYIYVCVYHSTYVTFSLWPLARAS